MRKFLAINRGLIMLMNLTGFMILLITFILVFFYPEVAGDIFARLVKSFRESLK